MFTRLDAALVASVVSLVAAGRIPAFDIETHCRDVAERAAPIGDADVCLRRERAARDRLAQQWARFAAADKTHCVELSRMAEPTYTELLTCLELAQEARRLRERNATGQAPQ